MPKKPQAYDPLSLACERVGRFLYFFSRVEMQLDAAITKIFKIDPNIAPIVTTNIDFARKVSIVQSAVQHHNDHSPKKKRIKMGIFSKVRREEFRLLPDPSVCQTTPTRRSPDLPPAVRPSFAEGEAVSYEAKGA
jgi:hypothetical protein